MGDEGGGRAARGVTTWSPGARVTGRDSPVREDSSIFMGSSCSLSPSSCAPGGRYPSETEAPGTAQEQTGTTPPRPHQLASSTTRLTKGSG